MHFGLFQFIFWEMLSPFKIKTPFSCFTHPPPSQGGLPEAGGPLEAPAALADLCGRQVARGSGGLAQFAHGLCPWGLPAEVHGTHDSPSGHVVLSQKPFCLNPRCLLPPEVPSVITLQGPGTSWIPSCRSQAQPYLSSALLHHGFPCQVDMAMLTVTSPRTPSAPRRL